MTPDQERFMEANRTVAEIMRPILELEYRKALRDGLKMCMKQYDISPMLMITIANAMAKSLTSNSNDAQALTNWLMGQDQSKPFTLEPSKGFME